MRSRALANEATIPAGPSLYDRDFALWVEAQVAAIRAGDPEGLDVENLVEELEGLTKRDERALGVAAQTRHDASAQAAVSARAGDPELGGFDHERP